MGALIFVILNKRFLYVSMNGVRMDERKSVCILHCHLEIPLKFLRIFMVKTPNAYARSSDSKVTYTFCQNGMLRIETSKYDAYM